MACTWVPLAWLLLALMACTWVSLAWLLLARRRAPRRGVGANAVTQNERMCTCD